VVQGFAAVNVFLYASCAYLYFFNSHLVSVRPFYLYAVTCAVTLGVVLFSGKILLPLRAMRSLFKWAVFWTLCTGGTYLWSRQSSVATQVLINVAEAMLLLVAFLFLFRSRKAVGLAARTMVVVALVGVAMNLIDFFAGQAWQMTVVPGRAAGLYENPNLSGQYLVLAMIIGIWVLPRHLRLLLAMVVGFGVLLTFSRASMIIWVIAMLSFVHYSVFPYRKSLVVLGVGGFVVLLIGAIVLGGMPGILEAVGLGERLNSDTIGRIASSFVGQRDFSAKGRLLVAQEALRLFLQSPLIGIGLGATREWSAVGAPHNMYAMLGAEMGIIGIGGFLWLIWIIWSARTPLARTMAVVFAVSSLFTHNQLEQVAMMVVIALTVAIDQEVLAHRGEPEFGRYKGLQWLARRDEALARNNYSTGA
jgi:O-antigen ligase